MSALYYICISDSMHLSVVYELETVEQKVSKIIVKYDSVWPIKPDMAEDI